MWKFVLLAAAALLVLGLGVAHLLYRQAMSEAEAALADVASRAKPPLGVYDPALVADLPEVARRYFAHAIQPGTPLLTTVHLRMQGKFLLGTRESYQTYEMRALQLLAPPAEFVWLPDMRSGVMQISGSDGFVQGSGWTRFWINGLVPVVSQGPSEDLNRSARTRAAMESLWVPASLLPLNGVTWEQIGPDTARITFPTDVAPVDVTLGPAGEVREVVSMRWSNENPSKQFRLQPFGGTAEAESSFDGFTIPSRMNIGNHFGTDAYLPFFQVELTEASYL